MAYTLYSPDGTAEIVQSLEAARYLVRYQGYGWTNPNPAPTAGGFSDDDTYQDPRYTEEFDPSPYNNISLSQVLKSYKSGYFSAEQAYTILTSARQTLNQFGMPTGGTSQWYTPAEARMLLAQNPPEVDVEQPLGMQYLQGSLMSWLGKAAQDAGIASPNDFASNFLQAHWQGAHAAMLQAGGINANSAEALSAALQSAKNYLLPLWTFGPISLGGGGGGGGPGRGSIGNRFDKQQLANAIEDTYNLYLRGAPKEKPVAMAQRYIDLVKASPRRNIDFQTWVRGQMEKDSRWKMAFANKPEGISPGEYMQSYAQQVLRVLGPAKDSGVITRELAALNASGDTVQSRLMLHDTVQKSSGFMSKVEDRYRKARNILGVL